MAARNSLDLDSDPRSVIGRREFDAPRELVFSVFTDPKHLSQWWGPDGFTTTTSAFEFRAGGTWRYVMHGPDGRDYQNRVSFDEIVAPERIAYRHGNEIESALFTTTITFEDLGNARTLLTWHARFPTAEARAYVIREHGADKGLVQNLAKLAAYVSARLEEQAGRP